MLCLLDEWIVFILNVKLSMNIIMDVLSDAVMMEVIRKWQYYDGLYCLKDDENNANEV